MTLPSVLLALAACLPPLAAQAQDSSAAAPQLAPDAQDEIVVRRGRPEDVSRVEVQRQARDVTMADDVYDTPLARFEGHLCPGILGLRVESAMTMIDRIRDNAHHLGIRLQDDGCSPNFIVAFVPDSQAAMQGLMDTNSTLFRYVLPEERRRILAPGPVHIYANVEWRTRDGVPISMERTNYGPPVSQQAMAHSRIYTSTRRDIASIFVLFDQDAVRGMSLGQLADYATMRGLAQTEPPREAAMNTILNLFNPQGPYPEELTDFDRAYLNAVYDWIPNLPAMAKIGNVNRELNRLADQAAAAAPAADE